MAAEDFQNMMRYIIKETTHMDQSMALGNSVLSMVHITAETIFTICNMVLEKSHTISGETRKAKNPTKVNLRKTNLMAEVGKYSRQIKVRTTVFSMASSKRGSDTVMEFLQIIIST
jgi:hypothetical protein